MSRETDRAGNAHAGRARSLADEARAEIRLILLDAL
jgi:hypothetical protein